MSLSPLVIEGYHLQKLIFKLKPSFEVEVLNEFNVDFQPTIIVDTEYTESKDFPGTFRIDLNVTFEEDEDFPYDFEIGYVGFFRVDDGFPESKKELLVQVNGPSILYAAAREFVSIVTSRAPYAPILLPSVSFVPEKPEPTIPKPKLPRPKVPKPPTKLKKAQKK